MLLYLIKRILLFIPTLLLVSILTFALSKLVQKDTVGDLLALEGMDSGMIGYEKIYNRRYKSEGLDKANFYISLLPNFVTHNTNAITDYHQRQFIEKMISRKYETSYSIALWNKINEAVKSNQLSSLTAEQWKAFADPKNMLFESDKIKDSELESFIKNSNKYRHTFHYPTLKWNGLNNQYHFWVSNFLKGNLGVSIVDGRSSAKKIVSALKWTFLILTLNILFTLSFAIPYGLYTGLNLNGTFDKWSSRILYGIYSMPSFWIATLLVLFFTTSEYGMKIFPSIGSWYQSGDSSFWDMISSKWTLLILPVGILVIKDLAYLGRLIRDTVANEAKKMYAKTALAKGANPRQFAYKHILPNALGPAITLAVGAIPSAIGGSLLMEVIFNIPGMGRLIFEGIRNADWAVVFPIVLLTAVMTIFWYLVGDLLISWLNPKIKL